MPNKYSEEFPTAGCRSVFPEGEENSFIWRMGRDDSGDSFRPGGRMKEARETILRGSFPRSKGQTGFIPKGRDDRGGASSPVGTEAGSYRSRCVLSAIV